MFRIHLLDTSISSDNIGDEIIVSACRRILESKFPDSYFSASSSHDGLGNYGRKLVEKADIVFLLGTNALAADWQKYTKWLIPISKKDIGAIEGKLVLLGVGANRDFSKIDTRQIAFLRKILSKEHYHSVRDEGAYQIICGLGLRAFQTGCPTTWGFTEKLEFKPVECDTACLSLTPYLPDPADCDLIEILRNRYNKIAFWSQHAEDGEYLRKLTDIDDIYMIPPNLKSYREFLSKTQCDVVGSRLHGGILALKYNRRSVIISVDHRARGMANNTNIPVIDRSEIKSKLEKILSSRITADFTSLQKPSNSFLGQFSNRADLKKRLKGLTKRPGGGGHSGGLNGASSIQIAYATDMDYLEPTLVSLMSVLENSKKSAHVHFLGYKLGDLALEKINRVCKTFPKAELEYYNLTEDMFGSVHKKSSYISLVTLARLYLPQLVDATKYEKILYIDSDTIVYDDLSPVFEMDLNGSYIAAVRDITTLPVNFHLEDHDEGKFDNFKDIMSPFSVHDYFNAGVLLIDCKAINNSPDMIKKMTDKEAISKYQYLDQSHLNFLFKGKVAYLDPKFNCFGGKISKYHGKHNYFGRFRNSNSDASDDTPVIVHFVGPSKPWNKRKINGIEKMFLTLIGKKMNSPKYHTMKYQQEASRYLNMLK